MAGLTLHIDLVTALHDDEQREQRKRDKTDENFPHDMSPGLIVNFLNKTPDGPAFFLGQEYRRILTTGLHALPRPHDVGRGNAWL
jgi:hypothetical protein